MAVAPGPTRGTSAAGSWRPLVSGGALVLAGDGAGMGAGMGTGAGTGAATGTAVLAAVLATVLAAVLAAAAGGASPGLALRGGVCGGHAQWEAVHRAGSRQRWVRMLPGRRTRRIWRNSSRRGRSGPGRRGGRDGGPRGAPSGTRRVRRAGMPAAAATGQARRPWGSRTAGRRHTRARTTGQHSLGRPEATATRAPPTSQTEGPFVGKSRRGPWARPHGSRAPGRCPWPTLWVPGVVRAGAGRKGEGAARPTWRTQATGSRSVQLRGAHARLRGGHTSQTGRKHSTTFAQRCPRAETGPRRRHVIPGFCQIRASIRQTQCTRVRVHSVCWRPTRGSTTTGVQAAQEVDAWTHQSSTQPGWAGWEVIE